MVEKDAEHGAKNPFDVRRMFGEIAGRYDLMNRLITLDQDRRWRRAVVKEARLGPGRRLLDVGAGTGGIALEALRRHPDIKVTAVDFTLPMLEAGRRRPLGQHLNWCQADALHLPFPNAVFDAVTSGYLIRNVTSALQAFEEQVRVLRPGGLVICLDTSPPPRSILQPLVHIHFSAVIPCLGHIIAGHRRAYTYLPKTTQAFFEPPVLADIMQQAGLTEVRYRTFMFGTMGIHVGRRPD